MITNDKNPYRRWGNSWLILCGSLGLHVLDEAMNDFLAFYNPIAQKISEELPYLPLPTFTFESWITFLIGAVILLFFLGRFAYAGKRWMRPLSYFFALVMIGNGLLHLGGSLVIGQLLPGTYSSPILLAGAFYLLWNLHLTSK